MNLDAFLREREPHWSRLDELVRSARGRPERLGPDGVRELGALYRSAAADLALARRRHPGDPVVARLEDLVGRARAAVYAAPPRRGSLVAFFGHGYWRRIRERPVPLLVAWALLLGPAVLAAVWALNDPGAAIGVVPAPFRGAASPSGGGAHLNPADQAAFSSQIFTNNIKVTFIAFAGGLTAGLLTALVLVFNGVLLGAVAGLATGAGRGGDLVTLITAHGVLELSCIAVTAAAGLRLGWALVEPGRRRRADALVAEARPAIEVLLGTMPWLVVAGLVEGCVSGSHVGAAVALPVGIGLGVVYWTLVLWRGRARAGVEAAGAEGVHADDQPAGSAPVAAGGAGASAGAGLALGGAVLGPGAPAGGGGLTGAPAPSP